MKKVITLFSLLLMAAVQMWAGLPTPKVEYVQLYANGPKWATMNLGATSVTDAGKYFWWGDVEGHAEGSGFSFIYTNGVIESYGSNKDFVADGQLAAEKDAATQQLGAGYRMPTKADFEDLYNKCTWTWKTNYNGVDKANGYLVQGKGEYEDNSIFLPAAGHVSYKELESVGENGMYWSSTAYDNSQLAYCLFFSSDANIGTTVDGRDDGLPIRPVYDNPAQAAYDYLVSLVGDKEYAYYISRIFVNEEGALQINNEELESDELVVDGNEYVFGQRKFVVENGAIAHVYTMDDDEEDEILYEYGVLVPESELVALMGDNVYVGDGNKIAVSEGQLTVDGAPLSSALYTMYLSKIGDNYVYGFESGSLVFVVEDNEVARVDMRFGNAVVGTFEKQSTVAQIGETIYTDVDAFIDAFGVIEGTATVKLLDDMTLSENQNFYNAKSDADITLDLNGPLVLKAIRILVEFFVQVSPLQAKEL
ncbi:MAG: hypothetical protein MJZ15_11925 [Bacteroidales bacterium]|nr:hypothetical protein [Bacteroidales bacterium]